MKNIKSMTGYGKGVKECQGKRIIVEIKSLNGKQMDLSVRMPSSYRDKEFEVRTKISKALQRGKTDVFVTIETIDNSSGSTPINKSVFQSYFKQLSELGSELGFNPADYGLSQAILRLPDVLQNDKSVMSDAENAAFMEAVDEAIANIDSFRLQEGKVLIEDLLKRVDTIEKLKNDIASFDQERIETIRTRIRENIENMGISIDQNRFEQELIYYIEKLDITEEKIRLQNHLDYFREVCSTEEAPGRKIGFIAQEIGREINTTGSKSSNSNMQRIVVEMKDELEKIKEQSLNLL